MGINYKQGDKRWGSLGYPSSPYTMAGSGCGPTACASIIVDNEDYDGITPKDTRDYMVEHGYATKGNGTMWVGITNCLKAYGMNPINHPTMADLWETLEQRDYKAGIILFRGGSRGGVRWTNGGHFVAFDGYKVKSGKHYLRTLDPGTRNHTGWFCYETTMSGLIPQVWSATPEKSTKKGGYEGELPTLELKKSNAQVIADTIAWAKWIASDNDFHYGYGKDSHHNGCYFCGTQPSSKKKAGIKEYEHTYCCNPFVGAAWAHGGCVPEAIALCNKGKSWGFSKSEGYSKSKLFDHLGHPAMSKLKAGDVLCKDTHVALYIGDGRLVEAAGSDDNKVGSTKWINSISVKEMSASRYKGFPRVHRFNSSVSTSMALKHGEVSDRVKLWQAFLNWYFEKKVVAEDREFGEASLKYTKEFQKAVGLTTDGIVGKSTLDKARKVE